MSRAIVAALGLSLALGLSACSNDGIQAGVYTDPHPYWKTSDPKPPAKSDQYQRYVDLPVAHAPYGGCKEARLYPHTEGYRWCKRNGLLPVPTHSRWGGLDSYLDRNERGNR